MGASSSCCFCIAKAEESPCTENGGVAELEMVGAQGEEAPCTENDEVANLETVGVEGASTSGRTEYYSERCEAMKRSGGKFSDDVALEIEFSKSHRSEVSRLEVTPQSAQEEKLNRENRELFEQLREEYPDLFYQDLDGFVLGRMIAKGGQAEIFEVVGQPDRLMKVFERGTSLRDLRQSWPLPVFNEDICHCIFYAGLLKDGRFAFLMYKCWGDLRKLIDQAMQEKNVDGIQGPPFPYNGWKEAKGWNLHPVDFMLGIARHMLNLHEKGVSHRDLKASNILLRTNFRANILRSRDSECYDKLIMVADFECSIGVLGTGFWRGPEILSTLGNHATITNEQWKKADVYSYGITCFEIVTGRLPFDGELTNTKADRQLVIEGKRPQLPSDLDDAMKDLITKCWASNPSGRPTFSEIVNILETISIRQCEFRLFGIDDELPLQYRLATVQEVGEYPIALMKVMPRWQIANLANGSVNGCEYGMSTRLVKQSNASHKLARLHH